MNGLTLRTTVKEANPKKKMTVTATAGRSGAAADASAEREDKKKERKIKAEFPTKVSPSDGLGSERGERVRLVEEA